ncbi:RrF2 family transcriptional regulator [Papillibacter cinnamivorans]|uniref:Transcriptional regulator, BadM/Rrf2 family n=1 Tax=Papillibacter cinnamivorans DSM 12816 TaxID=1122930 RepID=A0A1W2AT79_9FIRM|nr:RrF2 family transcriptional regulator [Papillibacter cinnamivorans]SMC63730.1 transcriptional regulator, BadM/Rrf2 family [Papillibacter cinnamivorans DSM 12816]
MMVSTKGRYALRVMVDLSEHNTGVYVPLKDIAARQDISPKYLESIMTVLSKAGLVDAVHGKGGGYRLNRAPHEYTVGSILKLTEGTLAPVACLEHKDAHCSRAASCRTLPMWTELDRLIDGYFEGITVGDLAKNISSGDYVI